MAIVQSKLSDISGKDGEDEQFATVYIRRHPLLQQPKTLDVLLEELDLFKDISEKFIPLEVKKPDGTTMEIFVDAAAFNKVVTEDILKAARHTRGRIPGTRLS